MSDKKIAELAALSDLEYEKQRTGAAADLGIRVSGLDKLVREARKKDVVGPVPPEPDPWDEEVDGDDLLDGIANAVRRYLILPPGGAELLALWSVHSYCYRLFGYTPRLAISAPEKGSGKTRVLDILDLLVPRPVRADNLSAAVMFRVVDAFAPTLLIDEVDRYLGQKEELIGIINSGYQARGQSWRCEGEKNELKAFSTFAPLALAGIGRFPDTIEDRSIKLTMQRRRPDETIERFRADKAQHLRDLARMAVRWVADNEIYLGNADPIMPEALLDRPSDNWRPLIAVADAAGGDWPERARRLALQLSNGADDDKLSVRTLLLSDLRDIFSDQERMPTKEIIEHLIGLVERPWPEYRNGKPITDRQLAKLLSPVKIHSKDLRLDSDKVLKGYLRADFEDAFARYLPPVAATSLQPPENSHISEISIRDRADGVADGKSPKTAKNGHCRVVAAQNKGERADVVENDFDPVAELPDFLNRAWEAEL